MNDSKILAAFNSFRDSRFYKPAIFLVAFFIFVLIMDKIVMPLYVHLGDEIKMPDVVDKSADEAKKILEKQDFHVIFADSVYDAHFDVGSVVEQMPIAYSTVKAGRNVYLTVSIGEKPIIMPNLISMSPRDAELKLKSIGLNLRSTYYDYSNFFPEGVVIVQSFPQGQEIKKGSDITITVSLGEMPKQRTIPNIVGKSLTEARQQLQKLGVTISNIEYEESESYLPETVLKQSLSPGSAVSNETQIDLTVSKLKS